MNCYVSVIKTADKEEGFRGGSKVDDFRG
jgi:hypothetical protein